MYFVVSPNRESFAEFIEEFDELTQANYRRVNTPRDIKGFSCDGVIVLPGYEESLLFKEYYGDFDYILKRYGRIEI